MAMAGLSLSACEDKLNIEPRGSISPDAVTPADTEVLLNGVYDGFQGGATSYQYLSLLTDDLSSDNLAWRATFSQHGEVDNNAIQANNLLIQYYWQGLYKGIYRANFFLQTVEKLDESTFSNPARKKEVLAEARFLRAYGYYGLVTRWGGVPILTEPTNEKVARNSEEEVWNFIVEDLKYAVENAGEFKSSFYVSKPAAKALLARVYLIRKNYAEAERLAEEVIANNKFSLSENFESVFASKENSERIFSLNSTTNDQTSLSYFLLHNSLANGQKTNGGRFELPADPSLVAAYESGDKRKDVTVQPTVYGGKDYNMVWKYRGGALTGDAWPVARVAEMYLVSAEARAEQGNLGGALDRINDLRAVRGLSDISASGLGDFELKIENERRLELAIEGFRWYDLIRTGRAIEVLPNVTNKNQLKYPIPLAEITVNELLEQNEGY
ncbi:RagB/SusD family nutrient uptake outer membrane protein [Pontibacter rugosus]|uniref:RagB/SusD family nutrient uptake outer membrane protein n=2 Tax=Pontibacter rugosus TaxID=1745966 RepID=A0ABW3SU09_9BACT